MLPFLKDFQGLWKLTPRTLTVCRNPFEYPLLKPRRHVWDKSQEGALDTHSSKKCHVIPASVAWPSKGAITGYTVCIRVQIDDPYSSCQMKPRAWLQKTARPTHKIVGNDNKLLSESTNCCVSCFILIDNQNISNTSFSIIIIIKGFTFKTHSPMVD